MKDGSQLLRIELVRLRAENSHLKARLQQIAHITTDGGIGLEISDELQGRVRGDEVDYMMACDEEGSNDR